jgi:hypothetical protein
MLYKCVLGIRFRYKNLIKLDTILNSRQSKRKLAKTKEPSIR